MDTTEFDEIRPYNDEELPQIFEELIADPAFQKAATGAIPNVPFELLAQKMRACKTKLDFQEAFCYGILLVISAAIESEVAQLENEDEQKEFLASLGLEETGLSKVIRAGYNLLGLETYFTAGPKEVRAWTFLKGSKAPQCAGIIHSDFERGFIRAETIAFADLPN